MDGDTSRGFIMFKVGTYVFISAKPELCDRLLKVSSGDGGRDYVVFSAWAETISSMQIIC